MTSPTQALAILFLLTTGAGAAASDGAPQAPPPTTLLANPAPEQPPSVEVTTTPSRHTRGVTSSTSTASPSSTTPFEINYSFRIGIHPSAPLRSLQIKLIWAERWTSGFYCNLPAIGTTPASFASSTVDEIDLEFDFGSEGLQQSQSILKCSVHAWHAEAYFTPQITFVDARDLDDQPVDVTTRLCLDCGKSRPPGYGGTAASNYDNCSDNLCGDVVVDGTYNTSDAQLLLKTAVGAPPSYPQRFDVDRDGKVLAIDALRVLRHAVGLPSPLFCAPPPLAECDVVQLPVTSTTLPWASSTSAPGR